MQWKLNNEKKKLMSECCNKLPFNPLCLESDSTLLLSLSALLHVQFSLAQAFIYFRGGGLVQWFHVLSFHNLVLEPMWLSLLVVCPDFLVSVPHLPVNEGASQVALVVKNPSAKAEETRVQSPGRQEPLEEGMATLASLLAWRIPWTKESGGLQSIGS